MGNVSVNPYTGQTIVGYNTAPPPDDGSITSANKLEWAKHKTKLADPVKTLAEAVNTAVTSAFAKSINTDAGVRNQISGSLALEYATATIDTDIVDVIASSMLIGTEAGATDDTIQVFTSSDNFDGARLTVRQRAASEQLVFVHATSTVATATGANIYLATGDIVRLSSINSSMQFEREDNIRGGWVETNRSGVTSSKEILQIASLFDGAQSSGAVAFPIDNTIPTATEGTEFMNLSFAANEVGSELKIEYNGYLQHGGNEGAFGLFTDIVATATSDALKVGMIAATPAGSDTSTLSLQYIATSTTTATQTFSIRSGTTGAASISFNGNAAAVFGGAMQSSLIITEIK